MNDIFAPLDQDEVILEGDDDLISILGDDDVVEEDVEDRSIPGAVAVLDDVEEEEDIRDRDWEKDGDHSKFIDYMQEKITKIPSHSGQTTVGCERAIAYLNKLNGEISKAIRSDEENKIRDEDAEEARDQIFKMIERLENALDKLTRKKQNKRAEIMLGKRVFARINDGTDIQYFISVSDGSSETLLPVQLEEPTDKQVQAFVSGEGLKKEATKTTKIQLFEDPFMHALSRILIESHVTHGKDVDEEFQFLAKKYKLTDRERLSLQEVLLQKGLPFNKDLARDGDGDYHPSDGRGSTDTIYEA